MNFFITPDDKSKINAFFKSNDCLVIPNHVKTKKIESDLSLEQDNLFQIFLTTKNFKKEISFKRIEETNLYYVDVVKSLVIEFDIGGFYPFSNKELHRGRLYCVTSFYENTSLVPKDQQFIKWMNHIFKLFPKDFLHKRNDYFGYFFSRNAIRWVDENNAQLVEGGLKFIANKK
jgi:hypothetical protein